MYKSEIEQALAGLSPAPGAGIESIIKHSEKAETNITTVLVEFLLTGNDGNKAVRLHQAAHAALAPLGEWIAQISPGGIVIELHELAKRFDDVLAKQPALELLLQPGGQALGELAGAFDVVLQRNKHPSSLVGLLRPAATLATCFAHYAALRNLFSQPLDSDIDDNSDSAVIEISGVDSLGAFAIYISTLSYLAKAAADALGYDDDSATSPARELRIESIESGSPVQIKLFGDGRTLRFLLAMLRDVMHSRTPHGRLMQAIDTLACAKKAGIKSPEILKRLEDAVNVASDHYVASLRQHDVTVSINGEAVRDSLSLPLPAPAEWHPTLPPPKD